MTEHEPATENFRNDQPTGSGSPTDDRIVEALQALAREFDPGAADWVTIVDRSQRRSRSIGSAERPVTWVVAAATVLVLMVGVVVASRNRDSGVSTVPLSTSSTLARPASTNASPSSVSPVPPPGRQCKVPGIEKVTAQNSTLRTNDMAEAERVSRSQAEMGLDLAVIESYGAEHPDDWIGANYEFDQPERVQAVFTANVDQHRTAINAKVSHPDRIDVRQGCYSKAALATIREEVAAQIPREVFRSLSDGISVRVGLSPAGAELAARLWAQYGDALTIKVGDRAYPPSGAATQNPSCSLARAVGDSSETTIAGLDLAVVLEVERVPSGADFKAKLIVQNNGTTRIDLGFAGASPEALIVRPGTREVVGYYVRGPSGVVGVSGPGLSVDPGRSGELPVEGGTAGCDPRLGYGVPPGEYDVIVPIGRYVPGYDKPQSSDSSRGPRSFVVSKPAKIVIE